MCSFGYLHEIILFKTTSKFLSYITITRATIAITMATPVELVAVLTPSPGRIDELIETIAPFNDYVKENEPGALRYQLYRQRNLDSGKEDLVYIEMYVRLIAVALIVCTN